MPNSRNSGLAWLCLFLGLVATFLPIFVWRGIHAVPGDLGDSRLVLFTLEHSYLFVAGDPGHTDFWDPPLFYPARNVAAFSDVMLSFAVLYWPWRALGFSPYTSFQLWWLVVVTLNFFAAYALMRRLFSSSRLAAAAGSYLFAFGSPRLAVAVHPQLVPAFFLIAALFSAVRAFELAEARELSAARTRRFWIALFALALTLQAWGSFYPFYFFGLAVVLACSCALLFRSARRRLFALARNAWPSLLAACAVASLALAPLAQRYLAVAELHGVRPWESVASRIPPWQSYLTMGTSSWFYKTVQPGWWIIPRGAWGHEGANGIGIVTSILVAVGVLWGWRRRSVRILTMTALLCALMTIAWPGGFTLWRLIYDYLPGAGAIRAVGRMGLLMLIPASVGLALFVDGLKRRGQLAMMVFLMPLIVLENGHRIPSFDQRVASLRSERIARWVEPGCSAFFVVSDRQKGTEYLQEDAMWAALESGVPTINGRYGNRPPGWHFRILQDWEPPEVNAGKLERWVADKRLDASKICLVELRQADPGGSVRRLPRRVLPSSDGAGAGP